MGDVTATNPSTGETVVLRDGQWVPMPRAPASATPQEQQRIQRLRNQRSNDATLPGAIDALMHGRLPQVGRLTDPAYQAALARAGNNVSDLARQVPSLDLGRALSETAQKGGEAWNSFWSNPGGNTLNAISGIPHALWAMTGEPLVQMKTADDAADLAHVRGDRAGEAEALDQSLDARARGSVNVAGLAAGPLVRGPASAAALAATMTAPQSLLAQQGTLQERIPQAAVDTALSSAIAAPLGLLGRRAPPQNVGRSTFLRQEAQNNLRTLDQANLPPMAGVINPEQMPQTMRLAQSPLSQYVVRPRMQDALGAMESSLSNIGQKFGRTESPEAIGDMTQNAIRRFNTSTPEGVDRLVDTAVNAPHVASGGDMVRDIMAQPDRNWGWRTKANALYQHVLEPFLQRPAQATATRAVLDQIGKTALLSHDPMVSRLSNMLDRLGDGATINDLRDMRTSIRGARTETLTQDRNGSELNQLDRSLTQDISGSLPSDAARRNLQLVDQYYAQGAQRMSDVLTPLADRGSASAFGALRDWASSGRRADTGNLLQVKHALRPDEWRSVAASFIHEMAQKQGHFDLETFVRNYDKMTPSGRNILFGGVGGGDPVLGRSLDQLAAGMRLYRDTGAFRNTSNTAVHLSAGGLTRDVGGIVGGAAATALHSPALGAAMILPAIVKNAGDLITAELLTNPRFVRWLARIPNTPRGISSALPQLATLAARDPQLVPALQALRRAQVGASADQPEQMQQPQPGGQQTELVPALAQ